MKTTVEKAQMFLNLLETELQFLPARVGTDNKWNYAVNKNIDKIQHALHPFMAPLIGVLKENDVKLANAYDKLMASDPQKATEFRSSNRVSFERMDDYKEKFKKVMAKEVDVPFYTITSQQLSEHLNPYQQRIVEEFMVSKLEVIR